MYRFSRSIYRELAPHVQPNGVPVGDAKRHLLDASEATMRRLAFDGKYFARPARTLFCEVRGHFPLEEQAHAYVVIDRYISMASEHLEQMEDELLDGQARSCRASTRKGTPCRREPLPGRDYCPSHKHLEEAFEFEEETTAARERSREHALA